MGPAIETGGAESRARERAAFLTDTLKGASELLPGYKLNPARDTSGSIRRMALNLPASVTAPLLSDEAAAFHARINDVLLAGFVSHPELAAAQFA